MTLGGITLWWKTIPSVDDGLQWKTNFGGGQPSVKFDLYYRSWEGGRIRIKNEYEPTACTPSTVLHFFFSSGIIWKLIPILILIQLTDTAY